MAHIPVRSQRDRLGRNSVLGQSVHVPDEGMCGIMHGPRAKRILCDNSKTHTHENTLVEF